MKKLKKLWSVAIIAIFLLNTISYPAYGMRNLAAASRYDGIGTEDKKHAKQVKRLAGKAEQGREDLEVSNLLASKRFTELFGDDEVEIRRLLRKISSAKVPFNAENIEKVLKRESESFGINSEEIEELAKLIPVAIMGTVPIWMAKEILAGKTPAISLTNVRVTVSDKFARAVDVLLSSVYIKEQCDKPAIWLLTLIYNSIAKDDNEEAKKKLSYLLRRAYNAQRIERAKSIFNSNTLTTIETLGELKGDFEKTLEEMKKLFAEAEQDTSQYYAMQARALLLEDATGDAGANLSSIDVPDGFKKMVRYALNSRDGTEKAEEYAEDVTTFVLLAIAQGEEKGEEFARYLFRQVRLLRGQEDFGWTAEDVMRRLKNRMEGGDSYTINNRDIPKGFGRSYNSYTTYYPSKIRKEFVESRGLLVKTDLHLEPAQGTVDRRLYTEAKEVFEKAEKSSLLYFARAIDYEPVIGISQFNMLSMLKDEYTGFRKLLITASTFYNKEGKPKPFAVDFLSKLSSVLQVLQRVIIVAPHEDRELIKELEKSLDCEVIGPAEAKEKITGYSKDNIALIDAGFLEREDLSGEEKEWVGVLKDKFPERVITIGKVRKNQRSLNLLAAIEPFVREEAKEKFLAILAATCLNNGVTKEQTAGIIYEARMGNFNWVITPSTGRLASYREAEQEYWAGRKPIEGMK
ncbi:MAG: hypothetical protein KAS87_04190 [Candidatus Omnitrophica bacterium]|nr:hypothetical protein [Candidatus Omnitrophota bacterium]